jgi:hypothetical protein
VPIIYLALIAGISHHLYKTPLYRMDALQYMGNALLMEKADIVRIHTQVYAAVRHSVPEAEQEGLLGYQADAPADQNHSRELRSHDPYRFGEFLPLFAIRPLYNQLIYVAFKAGAGLIGSTILISAISYFLLGSLLFVWIRKRSGQLVAATFSSLLMISPPMMSLEEKTFLTL